MEAADRILCQKLNNLDLLPPTKKLYDLTDNDVIRIIYSILNIRENEKSDIQTPKSTLARFKLVTRTGLNTHTNNYKSDCPCRLYFPFLS